MSKILMNQTLWPKKRYDKAILYLINNFYIAQVCSMPFSIFGIQLSTVRSYVAFKLYNLMMTIFINF